MNDRVLLTMREDGTALLKMTDTERKNVFANDFIDEIVDALDRCENELKPKALVFAGLPEVFSAGAEKKNLLDLCDGKIHVKDLVISERLVNAPFPVIAAMEGHAVGGGLVMALCCDIVIAARESRYGVVFMSLGFTPGMGCTTLLRELVGPYIANEMMFTGRLFKGSELAQKATNINYILPRSEVMAKADDVARQISEKNVKSLYMLKYSLSAPKKKLLIEARLQEDLMHRLSFGFPETRKNIEDSYNK
jgi:polyketide biosynthesis enoyl-CoA hydratase PksI